MKCTNCGNETFFETKILDNHVLATEGYVAQTVRSYACLQCGHIELFVSQNDIDAYNEEQAKKKKEQDEKNKLAVEIENQEKNIIELRKLINDENQTVKTVKEAKANLELAERKLNDLLRTYNAIGKDSRRPW